MTLSYKVHPVAEYQRWCWRLYLVAAVCVIAAYAWAAYTCL